MLSKRMKSIQPSGIRKIFDMAATLESPINLSIGQPDFDAPFDLKQAAIAAIENGQNRYTPSAGLPKLRANLLAELALAHPHSTEDAMVTSGTCGALTLALMATVDHGDGVMIPDPFFVAYKQLVLAVGGEPQYYDMYPEFKITRECLEAARTSDTKVMILNSPSNPTGAVLTEEEVKCAVEFAREYGIVIISDEIYSSYIYEGAEFTPAMYYDKVITVGGWSKTLGITGWRVGWAASTKEVITEMTKLQQFTFVCAPSMAQQALQDAPPNDFRETLSDYRKKRDLICEELSGSFELVKPRGSIYVFPKLPEGITGEVFVKRAIERNVLVIPGTVFSQKDTHFRVGFAASEDTLKRGAEILSQIAKEF